MPTSDQFSKSRVLSGSLARPQTGTNPHVSLFPEHETPPLGRGLRSAGLEARGRQAAASIWPAEIAFLVHHGVAPGLLSAAVAAAKRQGVSADVALLAGGAVSETHFYSALARHLKLPFLRGWAPIAASAAYPHAIQTGTAPLADPAANAFLIAPRGAAIDMLIRDAGKGAIPRRIALTTPTHFARLLRAKFRRQITHDASLALPLHDAALSARRDGGQQRLAGLWLSLLALSALTSAAPLLCATLLGLAMMGMVILRLMASTASLEAHSHVPPPPVDADLPIYSIVIALYREAHVVPQLVTAINRLDYPAAKLDIKFVIEENDQATLQALRNAIRSPMQEIIVAPAGLPRTKPRALNVALPLLRGRFTVVFDAEDLPEPIQIKMAAARFARAPHRLACLQAKLAIDNLYGWLPQLFAIEYAALFDVINVGLADLAVPFPLGGSSNHFRTSVLREVGGWDAWNVTEDADIGFRLARFGYRTETLPATTFEEAPATLQSFIRQRRRWCKGWYQTLGTLCRSPRRLIGEVGLTQAAAMFAILFSNVLVPLGLPIFTGIAMLFLASGRMPWPSSDLEIGVTTLWTSVFLGGAAAVAMPILLGMRHRRLLHLWPKLLLLPIYYAIVSAAAWLGLFELAVRPHHWSKTEHGMAQRGQRRRWPWSAGRNKRQIAGFRIDGARRVF